MLAVEGVPVEQFTSLKINGDGSIEQPGTRCNISLATPLIKRELTEWLYKAVDGVVQSGPFAGMKLLRETAWTSTYLPPLLLGCYEEELHGEVERQVTRLGRLKNPIISVVGCAEGYYAIGFKRRLPKATVYAVDSEEKCMAICGKAGVANAVSLTFGVPVEVFMRADLIFMDVEGAEVAYLDPEKLPQLRDRHIIVEVHDFGKDLQETPEILLDRFRGTHHITMLVSGGPRNPSKYPWLCAMHSDYQWLAVSEGRPCLMCWYVMEPKGMVLT